MKNEKQRLLVGAHISVEGGVFRAVEKGASIGCTVIQIFSKSNRQWFAKPLIQDDINRFKKAVKATSMETIVVHASYLINLASANGETRTRSINALKNELERCQELGISFLVLHPGSHLKQGVEEGIELVAQGINEALEEASGKTMILLETMAGQGSSLGSTFEELAAIRSKIQHKKLIGFCLDTCHIFAAGYDFRTKKSYQSLWNKFDQTVGIENLKVIHVNDSKNELGSHVDRHEHLCQGKIGAAGFKLLLNDSRFFSIPKILETPKNNLEDDLRNINTIKKLLSSETKKTLNLNK